MILNWISSIPILTKKKKLILFIRIKIRNDLKVEEYFLI